MVDLTNLSHASTIKIETYKKKLALGQDFLHILKGF